MRKGYHGLMALVTQCFELEATSWALWVLGDLSALTVHLGGTAYSSAAGQWYQHPGWSADPQVGPARDWDIALFQLSSPVVGAPRSPLYTGYGFVGMASTGSLPDGIPTLYAAQNTVDRFVVTTGAAGEGWLLIVDFDGGTATRNALAGSSIYGISGATVNSIPDVSITAQSSVASAISLEGTSAADDSGGPAFANFGG